MHRQGWCALPSAAARLRLGVPGNSGQQNVREPATGELPRDVRVDQRKRQQPPDENMPTLRQNRRPAELRCW
eukprot:403783-Rhodomonas_salina.2